MNEVLCASITQIVGIGNVSKIVASGGRVVRKISARPIMIKGELKWQTERIDNNKALHNNVTVDELLVTLVGEHVQEFKQINMQTSDSDITLLISSQGKVHKTVRAVSGRVMPSLDHNRDKKYLLEEGMNIEPMVDLGVFTRDYKVIKDKYDKFRQINRFIEIIDHEIKDIGSEKFRIMDFGCGKSYLTFLVYYYFRYIRKANVEVVGYDLKADVVAECNDIASRYGYDGLKFIVGDLAALKADGGNVDMVISLHACDTATDYALHYAITAGVKYIFSAPCCQHELNSKVVGGGALAPLIGYGLLKERFSALLTDAVRAELLHDCGYEVDVLEFVDFSHSPKNLMLRCKLIEPNKRPDFIAAKAMLAPFKCNQKLLELITMSEKARQG